MSTISFVHFLETRYAIADRSGTVPKPDDVWFEKRRDLFRRYCLPSVKAQTCTNFKWLLFYSPEYLRETEDAIRDCGLETVCLCPIIKGDWENFDTDMRRAMRWFVRDHTHAISTRLDSDDMVAPDFIEIIQGHFTGQRERTFLNFEEGILQRQDRSDVWKNSANMFQSVIETVSDLQGIYTWHHGFTYRYGSVIQLQYPGRWIHIRHEANSAKI